MTTMRTEGTETATGPLSRPYVEVTLAALALVTIVAFESMAVSTAMPTVARELDAVRSYGFAFSVMLTAQLLGIVLAGVWTDRSGPLPGLFVGQALLAAGAATCGSSTRLDVFLVGRALTGLGGGLLVVMLYVVAGRVYPEQMRPKLFTYISAAWVVPSLAGPPLSAWLTENLSWRWVFWRRRGPGPRHRGRPRPRPGPGRHHPAAGGGLGPGPPHARAHRLGGPGHRRGRRCAAVRHARAGLRMVPEDGRGRGRPHRGRRRRAGAGAEGHVGDGTRRCRASSCPGRCSAPPSTRASPTCRSSSWVSAGPACRSPD